MIKFSHVYLDFHGFSLYDINLFINRGEKVTVFGAPGSGKTTLIKLLLRAILPKSGYILVNKINIARLKRDSLQRYRSFIGVMFQEQVFFENDSVFYNLFLPLLVSGQNYENLVERGKKILKTLDLYEKRDLRVKDLSFTERQLLSFGRALVRNSPIVILDDPIAQGDEKFRRRIKIALEELVSKNVTVFSTTSNPFWFEIFPSTPYKLEGGKLSILGQNELCYE